ncbi:RNA polymerase sigma-70 factor [Candidatus Neomarinimicrobiota bacterium]
MIQMEQQKAKDEQIAVDAGLVRRIRKGDPKAFADLFQVYCGLLISFAQGFVVDLAVAESIVQDVFVNTWKRREHLDPDGEIRAYLYTAVRNQALKQLRHTDVEQQSDIAPSETSSGEASPEEHWTREELARAIHAAVEQLPTRCRTIFIMNRFERLTYREIAQILGLSIKTVETQMGRALQVLRRSLSHLVNLLL